MTNDPHAADEYARKVAAESKKWGDHLKVEATGQWHAWLDHPRVAAHYRERALVDGRRWEEWAIACLGGTSAKSLELGCGAGSRSLYGFPAGALQFAEGVDVSEDRIAHAERDRARLGRPGSFRVADVNRLTLAPGQYDLVFSCHSFHHFMELEHIMAQVHESLTPNGLFILEEFVGPTQFQWTDRQLDLVRTMLSKIPPRLRRYRDGQVKMIEGRPTPEAVVAVSPFESIRSGEIEPLFKEYFEIVTVKRLGGTIQQLLHNGIIHNFAETDADAMKALERIWLEEDALIDSEQLPSDFALLIGCRKT